MKYWKVTLAHNWNDEVHIEVDGEYDSKNDWLGVDEVEKSWSGRYTIIRVSAE